MNFLFRYAVKTVLYFGVLLAFMALGSLQPTAVSSILVASLILSALNTLLRPVFVAVALPFNIITFGLASIFANLLALVIANGIAGGALTSGFWAMLLIAFVIMLIDDGVRLVRQAVRMRMADV